MKHLHWWKEKHTVSWFKCISALKDEMLVWDTDEFWHPNMNIYSLAFMEVISKRWKVYILLSFHHWASCFILIPSSLALDTNTVYLISQVIQPWCLLHQCKWNLGFYNFSNSYSIQQAQFKVTSLLLHYFRKKTTHFLLLRTPCT